MTTARTNSQLHVVIAGAGVAGLEALIALRQLARDRVAITLLAPERAFVYRPLSVGEPFALGEPLKIPVAEIAAEFNVEVIRDGLAAVSPEQHTIRTTEGRTVSYDRLIVATGASREAVYRHATTFRGQEDAETVHGLVRDVEDGYAKRIAFVVPPGVGWSLPLYELALMTARRAFEMSEGAVIDFVTPEERPLAVFGAAAGTDVQALMDEAGIRLHCSTVGEIYGKGSVLLRPTGERIDCDRIVTLPTVRGRTIEGLPSVGEGFIPIDDMACVTGLEDIFAAGDGTNFPIKQGGLACQQADVAAEQIAHDAGIPLEVTKFRPVLRGQLMTGGKPHFMRRDVSGRSGDADASSDHMLWWPPSKVAGKYLAPYLAARDNTNPSVHGETPEVELHGLEFATR
jgi:sulfide:quinone oxidoreductase